MNRSRFKKYFSIFMLVAIVASTIDLEACGRCGNDPCTLIRPAGVADQAAHEYGWLGGRGRWAGLGGGYEDVQLQYARERRRGDLETQRLVAISKVAALGLRLTPSEAISDDQIRQMLAMDNYNARLALAERGERRHVKLSTLRKIREGLSTLRHINASIHNIDIPDAGHGFADRAGGAAGMALESFIGIPYRLAKDPVSIGVFALVAGMLYLAKQMATSPFNIMSTMPGFNPLIWFVKSAWAEGIGEVAENIRFLASELGSLLGKAKLQLAGLDKAASMRQSGFGIDAKDKKDEGASLVVAAGSLLSGKRHAIDCYLREIDAFLAGFAKNKRQAKKFVRQIRLLKGIRLELLRARDLIDTVRVAEDLVDGKKGGLLQMCVASLEGDVKLLIESLVGHGVKIKTSGSSGARRDLYSGGLSQ